MMRSAPIGLFGLKNRFPNAWKPWNTSEGSIMEIQTDYKELFECFNAHDVHYWVVGAYALAFHGCPR